MTRKENILYLDLGFYESCNMQCSYCRDSIVYDKNEVNLQNQIANLNHLLSATNPLCLKVSGYGEITQWAHLEPYLKHASGLVPCIQIISNGAFSSKLWSIFEVSNRLSLNFTIDGIDKFANSYRTLGSEHLHSLMHRNLCSAIERNYPLEVNCLIHNRSFPEIERFLSYLNSMQRTSPLIVFPFPVKHFNLSSLDIATISMLDGIKDTIEDWWKKYPDILPSSAYKKHLIEFLSPNSANTHCHVHYLNVGCGPKGTLLKCANYGEELSHGEISKDETIKSLKDIRLSQRSAAFVGPNCNKCFNHFHELNNFANNEVDWKYLRRLPSLSFIDSDHISNHIKGL